MKVQNESFVAHIQPVLALLEGLSKSEETSVCQKKRAGRGKKKTKGRRKKEEKKGGKSTSEYLNGIMQ